MAIGWQSNCRGDVISAHAQNERDYEHCWSYLTCSVIIQVYLRFVFGVSDPTSKICVQARVQHRCFGCIPIPIGFFVTMHVYNEKVCNWLNLVQIRSAHYAADQSMGWGRGKVQESHVALGLQSKSQWYFFRNGCMYSDIVGTNVHQAYEISIRTHVTHSWIQI